MDLKKEKEQTSIAIVVSLDGSSDGALKIVMLHTDGSQVITTTLASITRAGINYIRSHGLTAMFESNGVEEIAAMMESGNEQS